MKSSIASIVLLLFIFNITLSSAHFSVIKLDRVLVAHYSFSDDFSANVLNKQEEILSTSNNIQGASFEIKSAAEEIKVNTIRNDEVLDPIKNLSLKNESAPQTPQIPKPSNGVKKIIKKTITAYSSSPDETDSTPFITARNTRVRDGIVATNSLPFGAKIMIPEIFGEKIFIVEDRMHPRYGNRIDIWMPSKKLALEFGKKIAEVHIIEM